MKGRKYFSYPNKYYCVDPGLCNARLNFRQIEETHLMENIIYNELLRRGLSVDVGVVSAVERSLGKQTHTAYEIDFVVNAERAGKSTIFNRRCEWMMKRSGNKKYARS